MNWVTWEHVGVDRIGCAWLLDTGTSGLARVAFSACCKDVAACSIGN